VKDGIKLHPDGWKGQKLNGYVFQECYRQAFEEGYDALIYTSINSKGSATHQNAVQAREDFFEEYPQARGKMEIYIIDSRCYTMGYGWAVLAGARMAAQVSDAEEIVRTIQSWVDRVRILFVPYDLKFAKKSGRVSAAAAFVGDALGLKPIMTFEDGESKILAKVRGEKNVIPTLLDIARKERDETAPYLIIRADRADQADLLSRECSAQFGQDPAMEFYIGGGIAINAGPHLAGLN